jgi:hypothetical protein
MISFNFQDSNYLFSFENCIRNVRKFYPNELIDFYIDSNSLKINEYKKICHSFNVEMTIRQRNQGYINRTDSMETNIPKMLESHYRIYNTCKKSNDEWVMLLEDDVLIKREIKHWPKSDCGKNRDNVGFLGGGSIFKRDVYLQIYESLQDIGLEKLIRENHTYSWAGDALKQRIFKEAGASDEKWIELAEPGYYDDKDHAVYHGYKDLHKLG